MRARIRRRYDDKYGITVHLPAEPMELYDMLDRIGTDNGHSNVYINIEEEYIPRIMREGGFYDDIFKLNLLAVRVGELPPADRAGFTAVLVDHEEYNLDDVILVTYGLDAYPVYPCKSYAELGEIVIDNEMIPEVENCPDELIDYLSIEYIGKLAAERFKGMFVDGYYCETADFTLPDMKITIRKPERNRFQLLLGTDEKTAQWYTLPCRNDLSDLNIYDIRSPLPNIKRAEDITKLNEVAEKIAGLDFDELVKLKAVMESNYYIGAGGALKALSKLDRYELDREARSDTGYGMEYLRRQLPSGFDTGVLNSEYLNTVGSRILDCKGAALTSYGIVSGIGQELYSALTVSDEEAEDEEENEKQEAELS